MKGVLVVGVLLTAAPLFAQPQRAGSEEQLRVRYQIGVMERVLEQAVQLGAQMTGRQVQSASPSLMLFAGPARARGFRIEGYGMFFDVEVPVLRRSVTWSIRALNQSDLAVTSALKSLRDHVQSINDRGARTDLDQALRRLELQVGIPPAPAPAAEPRQGQMTAAAATTDVAQPRQALAPSEPRDDPDEAYTAEVKRALIDAMLDHSGPIAIGPDEWLTVAARDNEERLSPGDMYDVLTIVLRIKGSDLVAFRADRLTRDEARNRVEAREF